MYLNGRIGQVLGPFNAGEDLLAPGGAIANFTPEVSRPVLSKLGVQASPGIVILINNIPIKIGITGMYELDEVVHIKSLIFRDGADENAVVDFVY